MATESTSILLPMLHRIAAAALLLAGSLAFRPLVDPPTVLLLVRHAEKAAQPASDPPLSPEGEARALALREVAKDAGVNAIITTQYLRTRATAEPVARAAGITAEVIPAQGSAHAQGVADAIRQRFAGRTVLVVGHSNTISAIAGALGVPRPPDLCDSEYDQLMTVILAEASPPRLIRSRFGAPSPAAATGCPTMQAR